MVDDPIRDSSDPYNYNPGQDITKGWYAYGQEGGSNYHYFRIDLVAAPGSGNLGNLYGIFIDSKPNYGAPSDNKIVPGGLNGIDFILCASVDEIERYGVVEWDEEFLRWKRGDFTESDDLKFQNNERLTLEWRVKDYPAGDNKHIDTPFSFWGATMYPSDNPLKKKTFDITKQVTTPIPNAAWLLGAGVVALIGLKRRKPKP